MFDAGGLDGGVGGVDAGFDLVRRFSCGQRGCSLCGGVRSRIEMEDV